MTRGFQTFDVGDAPGYSRSPQSWGLLVRAVQGLGEFLNLDFEKGCYVAGGAVAQAFLGTEDAFFGRWKDFDIFPTTAAAERRAKKTLKEEGYPAPGRESSTGQSSTWTLLDHPVELIEGLPAPAHLWLQTFDLSVAQYATDGKQVLVSDQALEDLEHGVFTILRETTYDRVRKYARLGLGVRKDGSGLSTARLYTHALDDVWNNRVWGPGAPRDYGHKEGADGDLERARARLRELLEAS